MHKTEVYNEEHIPFRSSKLRGQIGSIENIDSFLNNYYIFIYTP